MNKLRKPDSVCRKVIEVLFRSTQEQNLGIDVSYIALHAAWKPIYKVDAPADLSSVQLTMFAQFEQRTGENWDAVALSVSNAVPLHTGVLPAPRVWEVGLAAPRAAAAEFGAVMGKRAAASSIAEMQITGAMAMADREAASASQLDEPPQASYQLAELRELPVAFEYELPERVSIASGAGETVLPLYSKQPKAQFFNYSVPREDPLAYLVAQIEPDSTLLAGRLNVHLAGRFVASTELSEMRPGEPLLCNLGVDRGMKIERRRLEDKIAERLLGIMDPLSRGRQLAFLITAQNLKDRESRLQILDSIPVPATDRVQLKDLVMEPQPTESDYRERKGVQFWEISLKPGETAEIRVQFVVKYPKSERISGL